MKKYCNTKKISRKKKKINKLINYYKLIDMVKKTEKQKDENLSSEHAKLKWIKLFSGDVLEKLKGYKL